MRDPLGDRLERQIVDGRKGLNKGYKSAFKGHEVRRGDITTIMGGTGSAKSFLAQLAFGWTPLADYVQNYSEDPNRVFHWFLYSMEMDADEITLRLAAYIYAQSEQALIPPSVIAGMEGGLTQEAEDWLLAYAKPKLNEYSKYITILGKSSVAQMDSRVRAFYAEHGELKELEHGEVEYTTSKHILAHVTVDHVALLKGESSKKSNIDGLAAWEIEMKAIYRTAFLNIQQLNRSEGAMDKLKHMDNPAPTLAEAKDSGDLVDVSTLVLAISSPHRFGIARYFEYQISGDYGLKDRGRFIFVLKSRHTEAGELIVTAFYGEAGIFMKLPKAENINKYIRAIQLGKWFGFKKKTK